MNLIKLLSNPIRMQVIQYLQMNGEATTKQISQAIIDVPAPTLYRHINALLKEEVLLVKEERKVRGSLERLLVINMQKIAEMENGNIADTAYQFLFDLYSKFHDYSGKPNADSHKDRLSLRTRILSLTDEDFDSLMGDIGAAMDKYEQTGKSTDRKLRSISIISSPVEEVEK